VATSLSHSSRTLSLLRERRAFSISLLADDQADVAVRAAEPGNGDKFVEQAIPLIDDELAPAVAGAALVLWCRLESAHDVENHVLVVGRVERTSSGDREPLLRFGRRYRTLGRELDVARDARYPL
jgi:flavin reductase (DIM6/NTAB) family NADH-FMN oxidoreductase RutF